MAFPPIEIHHKVIQFEILFLNLYHLNFLFFIPSFKVLMLFLLFLRLSLINFTYSEMSPFWVRFRWELSMRQFDRGVLLGLQISIIKMVSLVMDPVIVFVGYNPTRVLVKLRCLFLRTHKKIALSWLRLKHWLIGTYYIVRCLNLGWASLTWLILFSQKLMVLFEHIMDVLVVVILSKGRALILNNLLKLRKYKLTLFILSICLF